MANINPKLNLNKTPSIVESNSLVFAKNIRIDIDGSIHKDYSIMPMSYHTDKDRKGRIVWDDRLCTRIAEDIRKYRTTIDDAYDNSVYNDLISCDGKEHILSEIERYRYTGSNGKMLIVGVIPGNNEFYLFVKITYTYKIYDLNYSTTQSVGGHAVLNYHILKYDEKTDLFSTCPCNWNWSGGEIDGCVTKNLVGDTILNIGEYGIADLVPLKCINLNTAKPSDDESIYTQTPKIPVTNINCIGRFACVIPNGVYQFFVRYKIADDFYTDWFPASRELFVGNTNSTSTSFGTVKFVKTTRDSDNSFIFSIEHINNSAIKNYKSFQIGFIITNDDVTYARAWKHFDFTTKTINFDYKSNDIEEIEITDLLKVTFGLYNVNNITSFKNKLYISNYTETDFNESSLQEIANQITFEFGSQTDEESYDGNPVIQTLIGNTPVISGLKINNIDTPFSGENNIFYRIINSKTSNERLSISEAITNAVNDSGSVTSYPNDLYGIRIVAAIEDTSVGQQKLRQDYPTFKRYTSAGGSYTVRNTLDFSHSGINQVTIDGTRIYPTTLLTPAQHKEFYINEILKTIYNKNIYLNNSCSWVNSNGKLTNNIKVVIYRTATLTTVTKVENGGASGFLPSTGVGGEPGDDPFDHERDPEVTTTILYEQKINITYVAWQNKLNSNDATNLVDYTTLIPLQKYKFYMHFVKENGEISNGYYCSGIGEIEVPYKEECNSIIYPIFKNLPTPKNYVSYFFSIAHTENKTCTVFNIKDNDASMLKEASCVDINMMLIPGVKNIYIVQGDAETLDSQYYYSSDSSVPRYFGADGILTFRGEGFDNEKLAYFVSDYAISESEDVELIKCTPFLNDTNISTKNGVKLFDDYNQMNLLGFVCNISMLDRDTCIDYYTDGSSVYRKKYDTNDNFYLKELSKYMDGDSTDRISGFNLKNSKSYFIYSNYNLNYVSLSEEPKMSIKSFYNRNSNDTSSEVEGETKILRLFSSQLLSDLYSLPSMYKSYIRKTYSTYNNLDRNRFENTIRSSILNGDESKVYIYKFNANDYYNVPTNKGIIINLAAIGDAILAHTEDSMFKFSGSNTLQSSEGEIVTAESQLFDTGVAEMFGSEHGFAGIQNKKHHIITENGYIFFDKDSKTIYMYNGQGQITKISESIDKLFNYKTIDNIHFANDYYNNRFFVNIMFKEIDKDEGTARYIPVTLSFNFSDNSKAFVSLHDFRFINSFNTKTNCYFLSSDNTNVCYIDKKLFGHYYLVGITDNNLYPTKYSESVLIVDYDNVDDEELTLRSYDSIIDIIYNDNYERIKTLDNINWCADFIVRDFSTINENNLDSINLAESILSKKPCDELRIYSDTCVSDNKIFSNISNNYEIESINSYRLPRYNQGIWSFNYFRNIKNSKGNINKYNSDQNSLIEGKYFVARFVFKKEFKFETIEFNCR